MLKIAKLKEKKNLAGNVFLWMDFIFSHVQTANEILVNISEMGEEVEVAKETKAPVE